MVMPAILGRALVATLTNNEGADVMKRRLVVLDTSADAAFSLTTTMGDRGVLGVTLESVVLGATGRIVVQGVTVCLVEGAVTRGHYLRASATPGALEDAGVLVDAAGNPPAGSCAMALEAGADGDEIAVQFTGMLGGGAGAAVPAAQLDANGTTLDVDAIADGQFLKRVGATVVGAATPAAGPATQLDADGTVLDVNAVADGQFLKRVGTTVVGAAAAGASPAAQLDADGTVLDVNAVVDGEYLRRVGATIVSGTPAGGGGGGGWPTGEYNPNKAPASPSAFDDEFLAATLAAAWTVQDSGAGDHTKNTTRRPGWLFLNATDGGGGNVQTGVYKTFAPGATASTVVTRVHGHVRNAGSCQVLLQLLDGSGNLIWSVGMLNGAQSIMVADSGGFRPYTVATISNAGEAWLMLHYEGGTAYSAWVSAEGGQWARLEGASRSGTVGRIRLQVIANGALNANAFFDFVRTFPTNTFDVGGVG